MVFILPVDPDCQLGLIHNVLSFRSAHQVAGNKKATDRNRLVA